MMQEYKLLMLGSGGVGKTALARCFVANCFVEEYDPVLEELYCKQVCIGNELCMLYILDSTGQVEFRSRTLTTWLWWWWATSATCSPSARWPWPRALRWPSHAVTSPDRCD